MKRSLANINDVEDLVFIYLYKALLEGGVYFNVGRSRGRGEGEQMGEE